MHIENLSQGLCFDVHVFHLWGMVLLYRAGLDLVWFLKVPNMLAVNTGAFRM